MRRPVVTSMIYTIIGLAVIGVIAQLATNTMNFVFSLLIMIGIGAAIFAAVYFLFRKQRPSNEMKKYKQAVKQSKMKYDKASTGATFTTQTTRRNQGPRKRSQRRPTHLRVIDGNKSKKKRASN